MPKETIIRVQTGPGSVAPKFTPPTTPVATPSFAQREGPTDFSNFRDAILAVGRGASAVAGARSNIASRMQALKKQGVAETERLIERQNQQLQQQRQAESEQSRRAILLEAEKKGPDWVERQFRSRMVNAGSREESLFWEQAWRPAAAAVRKDSEEQFRQEFNSHVRSVADIATTLQLQIDADPATKAVLIGDGEKITSRVQDWMILKVNEAQPGVFDLQEGDSEDKARSKDMLLHQLMQQSFKIADALISEHNGNVEKSNNILGTQQLESDFFSTMTGQQDPSFLSAQVEATMQNRFGHLTVEQQRAQVRIMIAGSLTALGRGAYGIDALNNIGLATHLLDMKVDGQAIFSPAEKQRRKIDLLVLAESTAKREMESEIGRLRESLLPDPNALAIMTTQDPITGRTPIDDAANRVLAEMGFLGATNLNPEGQRIINAVRQAAAKIQDATRVLRNKHSLSVANHNMVMQGDPGADADKAHRWSPYTRAHMTGAAFAVTDVPPMGEQEIEEFKGLLVEVAGKLNIRRDVVDNWDGRNAEYTDDNADLNKILAVTEAEMWNNDATQSYYGIPAGMAKDKMALLRSDDTNKLMAFGHWVSSLRAGANASWDNFLDAKGVSSQEVAAAWWVRVNMKQGRPRFTDLGEVLPGDLQVDPAVLMTEVQAIMRSRPVPSWSGADTGLDDVDRSNAANMADVMAEIVSGQVNLEGDDGDRFGSRIQAQFLRLFLSDQDHTGRMLRNLWFAGRAAEPDLDDGQRGAMLWSWLRGKGYRWREINDRVVLIIDPQGYTGAEGAPIQGAVDMHMKMQFSPLYRSFIQDALDLEPFEVPNNYAEMFLIGSGRDPGVGGAADIRGRWNMSDQITDRLLESRANYGGFAIEGVDRRGNPMATPLTKHPTLMRWEDGTSFMVPEGVVMSVIGNQDLFAPVFRLPKARASLGLMTPAFAPSHARPGTPRPQL